MTAGFVDHLTLDAIVAFADGEMPMVAYQRAAAHVSRCPQCEHEVNQQMAARAWLRSACAPAMPPSLLDSLKSIPVAMPATHQVPPEDGSRSGHHRHWFKFLGAGAVVAGLAVGALAGVGDQPVPAPGPAGGQLVSGVATPFVVPVKLGTR
jgi:anti-sigma factor RsiW